jgi:trigger factor
MQVSQKSLTDTSVQLTVTADAAALVRLKQVVLQKLAPSVNLSGFRAGKAPLNLVEKNLDQSRLQTEFLDEAVNAFYIDAINHQKLRPVAQPKISITKFVPFDALEFRAEVEVVGEVKLANYKTLKVAKPLVNVTAKDINDVLGKLKIREADKKPATRASKTGDEVWIDFTGVDAKTREPINGADGKDFPLVLGSNTFIPGFEPELVGLKADAEKTFKITFPKDYGVATLQSREVSFTVTVKKVNEVVEPKLDDKFSAKVGPFKTLAELKADIKKQLKVEREREAQMQFENELVTAVTAKSTVEIPKVLVDEQLDAMENDERQNLAYRGQTWQEHLEAEGVNEEQHRERNRAQAEQRVKAGLVLSEIADKEKITATPEEVEIRMQILKGQYNDPQMQAELYKPEARRDITSRLLTEKTLAKLTGYSTKQ